MGDGVRRIKVCLCSCGKMMRFRASLLLVLLATTGLQAEYPRNGLWDYISQLTSSKGITEQGEQLKFSRETKSLNENLQDGVSYMKNFLGPLNSGFQERLYQDSAGLRQLIRKELDDLRRTLSPYVDEVHQKISWNVEQMRQRLTPYTDELLDQVSVKTQHLKMQLTPNKKDIKKKLRQTMGEFKQLVSEYAEEFHDQIILHTGHVKQVLHPYTDNIISEINQTVEELHRNVAPHSQPSQEQLNQRIQELSQKLTKNAKDLHENIHRNVDLLKQKLVSYPQDLRQRFGPEAKDPQGEDIPPYIKEISSQVEEQIEEFRKSTFLQIEDFTRTINRETEEINSKLLPSAPYTEEFQNSLKPVEDMQKKLNSLWEDIAQSMS